MQVGEFIKQIKEAGEDMTDFNPDELILFQDDSPNLSLLKNYLLEKEHGLNFITKNELLELEALIEGAYSEENYWKCNEILDSKYPIEMDAFKLTLKKNELILLENKNRNLSQHNTILENQIKQLSEQEANLEQEIIDLEKYYKNILIKEEQILNKGMNKSNEQTEHSISDYNSKVKDLLEDKKEEWNVFLHHDILKELDNMLLAISKNLMAFIKLCFINDDPDSSDKVLDKDHTLSKMEELKQTYVKNACHISYYTQLNEAKAYTLKQMESIIDIKQISNQNDINTLILQNEQKLSTIIDNYRAIYHTMKSQSSSESLIEYLNVCQQIIEIKQKDNDYQCIFDLIIQYFSLLSSFNAILHTCHSNCINDLKQLGDEIDQLVIDFKLNFDMLEGGVIQSYQMVLNGLKDMLDIKHDKDIYQKIEELTNKNDELNSTQYDEWNHFLKTSEEMHNMFKILLDQYDLSDETSLLNSNLTQAKLKVLKPLQELRLSLADICKNI